MKVLSFLAPSFSWRTHERTLDQVELELADERVQQAVVAFIHVDREDADRPELVVRKCARHLKWQAGKLGWKRAVLHSFTHLGGSGDAELARQLLEALADRLRSVGYEVWLTPFGHLCAWELSVEGMSVGKVWKEI